MFDDDIILLGMPNETFNRDIEVCLKLMVDGQKRRSRYLSKVYWYITPRMFMQSHIFIDVIKQMKYKSKFISSYYNFIYCVRLLHFYFINA